MRMLSFKQYLGMVVEDVQQDIAALTSQIAQIDSQINTRVQPLLQKKTILQKTLALKQKEAETQSKQGGNQQQNGQTPGQQPMQAANRTTTPGGTQQATPGTTPSLPQ